MEKNYENKDHTSRRESIISITREFVYVVFYLQTRGIMCHLSFSFSRLYLGISPHVSPVVVPVKKDRGPKTLRPVFHRLITRFRCLSPRRTSFGQWSESGRGEVEEVVVPS